MHTIIRGQLVTLAALLAAMVVTLAACGGGSSSAGFGGGSGGSISGTVNNGVAAVYPTGGERSLAAVIADLVVERAEAAGVAGVQVALLDGTGAQVGTQTTDANGKFVFTGLAPGDYTVQVLGQSIPVQVSANSKTEIELAPDGQVLSIEVEAEGNQISGEVEDDQSTDDESLDDNSVDDDSLDDNSADDDSLDDDSTEVGDDANSTEDDDSN